MVSPFLEIARWRVRVLCFLHRMNADFLLDALCFLGAVFPGLIPALLVRNLPTLLLWNLLALLNWLLPALRLRDIGADLVRDRITEFLGDLLASLVRNLLTLRVDHCCANVLRALGAFSGRLLSTLHHCKPLALLLGDRATCLVRKLLAYPVDNLGANFVRFRRALGLGLLPASLHRHFLTLPCRHQLTSFMWNLFTNRV